jgi:glyoxylate reductase
VCNFAVGFDNIDLAECRKRGVVVTNTPHAVTEGTADLAWALMLAARVGLIEARSVRAGQRSTPREGPLAIAEFLGRDLTGQDAAHRGRGADRVRRGAAIGLGFGMRVALRGALAAPGL